MASKERPQAECLRHLEASNAGLARFIHDVLSPYIGICTGQIGPHVESAASGEEDSGFWVNHRVVNVQGARNSRGLLIAEADEAGKSLTANAIAGITAEQGARPTRMLVFPVDVQGVSGVVLDVGVGSVQFGTQGWTFFNGDGGTIKVDPSEADVAIRVMWSLMYDCGLSTDLLSAMQKQLNLLSRDSRESTQQAQKMIDAAISSLVGAVKVNHIKFGTPPTFSPASSEWAVKLNKKPDNSLVDVTQKLLAQLGIGLGDLRLSNTDVQIGEDANRKPIVGFSNSDGLSGFIIIGPREDGKKLKIYGRVSDFEEERLDVLAELNTSKKIGAGFAWATACQEFVTPAK